MCMFWLQTCDVDFLSRRVRPQLLQLKASMFTEILISWQMKWVWCSQVVSLAPPWRTQHVTCSWQVVSKNRSSKMSKQHCRWCSPLRCSSIRRSAKKCLIQQPLAWALEGRWPSVAPKACWAWKSPENHSYKFLWTPPGLLPTIWIHWAWKWSLRNMRMHVRVHVRVRVRVCVCVCVCVWFLPQLPVLSNSSMGILCHLCSSFFSSIAVLFFYFWEATDGISIKQILRLRFWGLNVTNVFEGWFLIKNSQ